MKRSNDDRQKALDVVQGRCTDVEQGRSLARSRLPGNVRTMAVHQLLLDETLNNVCQDLEQLLKLATDATVVEATERQRLDALLGLTKELLTFFVERATANSSDSAAPRVE